MPKTTFDDAARLKVNFEDTAGNAFSAILVTDCRALAAWGGKAQTAVQAVLKAHGMSLVSVQRVENHSIEVMLGPPLRKPCKLKLVP
jgi:hypothetical protein